ncbi:MAG TPA: hypothetical protein VJ792_00495 [Candidatus Nitrosotalea sp.]|nr:hypothetical protein [Candidatus Nitrosotalea sp.]
MSAENNEDRLKSLREALKDTINKYFDGRYEILELCLSVVTQMFIEGMTLPFFLILVGPPSSFKTTILSIVSVLENTYRVDSFTAKAFVSHMANATEEDLKQRDLLPKIKDKTLITPELGPLFSTKDDKLQEIIGILTRILDGKGYTSESGARGKRGYVGDYYFTWLGAAVKIPRRLWKVISDLGPKMYFAVLYVKQVTDEEKQKAILENLRDIPYNDKLEQAKARLLDFWKELIATMLKSGKVKWDDSRNDKDTISKITMLAMLLGKLRASMSTEDVPYHGGSNYNFEPPVIEDPTRATDSLINLAKGHALLYGRNYIMPDDLRPVVKIALSSASRERVGLFQFLIEKGGSQTTDQVMEKFKVGRDTALKYMKELELIGLVERDSQSTITKPTIVIRLKEFYQWLLSDEFRSYWNDS